MDKIMEKKLASYLNKIMDYAEYAKIVEYMGKDRDKFNNWVSTISRANAK